MSYGKPTDLFRHFTCKRKSCRKVHALNMTRLHPTVFAYKCPKCGEINRFTK